MNTQPIEPNAAQVNIEPRLRSARTIWMALLASIGMYYVLTVLVGRPETAEPNPTLSLVLLVIGVSTTLISFVVKHRLIGQAVEKQRVDLVQQGYVLAWAITEVAALLGLVDFFLSGHRHYYVLIIIAAAGQLIHYPRREHLINASFNRAIGGR